MCTPSSVKSNSGQPALSWQLQELLKPDETAYSLFKRLFATYQVTNISFLDAISAPTKGIKSGSLVCLEGDSGSGKSEILLSATANCILPTELGGNASGVAVFSVDSKFNANRLRDILRGRILSAESALATKCRHDQSALDKCIDSLMAHVNVYFPRATSDLIMALYRFLMEQEECYSEDYKDNSTMPANVDEIKNDKKVSLLIIDGIGTNFYPNKVFDESSGTGSSFSSSYASSNVLSNLTKVIKQILMQLSLSILIGQQAIFSSKASNGKSATFSYMSRVYSGMNASIIRVAKLGGNENNTCFTAMLPDGTEQKFTVVSDLGVR